MVYINKKICISAERRASSNQSQHYSNRYLGDWEVKAKSHGGSEVNVSANHVPVSDRGRGRGDFRGSAGVFHRGRGADTYRSYPNGQQRPPPHSSNRYEGNNEKHPSEGRPPPPPQYEYRGRGRGRGYHHQGPNRRDEEQSRNGPVVQHDFSYLDELDKAYEKYFSSITKRHDNDQ